MHVEIDGRAEVHDDARAAIFRERRDAVGDAVGAHFLRVVVVDGHAGADARLDEEGFGVEIALGHLFEGGVQRRHHRTDDDAANFAGIEARQREQVAREDAVFVHGLVARGGQTPVGDQFGAAKNAEHRVGVAYVQSQKHQFLGCLGHVAGNDDGEAAILAADAQQPIGFQAIGDAGIGFRCGGDAHSFSPGETRCFG